VAPTRSIHLARAAGLVAALLFVMSDAGAETVMVQRRTRVMSRPTETADTILRVKQDRPAKVLRRGGGWVKVRIGDEVGWVPRSQIEEEESDDEAEEEEGDEVAAADEEEDEEIGEEDDEQESDEEDAPGVEKSADDQPAATATGSRFAASLSLGLRNLSSSFTSDGAMELGSYRLAARAYSAGFALDVVAYRNGPLIGIIDGRYQGSVGTPGVQFTTGEDGTGYVPFTTHDIDAGGRVGYRFAWLRASARLGYHADVLHVERVDNVGRMPSEVVRGYTIGAAIEVPFDGKGWSGRAAVDSLVSGKRKQTVGLEDGAPGKASASWTTLAVGYALSAKLCAELGYRRAKWTSSWSGTSAREADITSASRTDVVQQFTVGLSQSF
jgi:hypothetical protein